MDVGTGLAVNMTPLQYAVKQKSPSCIGVLLKYGANTKLKLKTPENKNLPITALKLAQGEKEVAEKHNEVDDAKVYDEIIQILSEHSSPQKEKLAGEPSVADPPTTSPFSNHRMALTISQNQLAIKNLERESTHLKAEVEDLKKELLALKKLINDKSLEDTPKSPSPSENANTPPKSATRTAASRARKKVDNGEESVKKQIRRPHSVMVTGSGQDFTNPHKKKKNSKH